MRQKFPYQLDKGECVQLYYDGRRHYKTVEGVRWVGGRILAYEVIFTDGTSLYCSKIKKVEVEL